MRQFLALVLFLASPALAARAELDGSAILERATKAAGGDGWANARSLVLEGRAVFWDATGAAPKSSADSYVMYREFDPARSAAHAAEGKVRIIASDKGRVLWTVGYDGATSWNDKGVIPKAQADAFWANNMGFGIIRHARKPGFRAERVADGEAGRHKVYFVRLTDPQGGITLFGIDQRSFAIRRMAFMTPRGWHERHYDDFIRLKNPDWLQARSVTLFYNGVKANSVFWRTAKVNRSIDPALFALPTPQ